MARVTRPGGTVAACVWDYSGQAFWDPALAVAPERAATVDEANMPWCRHGELAELWTAAGLTGIRSDSLIVRAAYDDFEDLWSPFPTGIGPSGAFCASLDERERALLRAAFQRELGVGDGPFELTARAWAVAGST